jgi:hypothetical protein
MYFTTRSRYLRLPRKSALPPRGEADNAEATFKKALAKKTYLSFLREDWKKSLSYYMQANEMVPSNPKVLLALARVN